MLSGICGVGILKTDVMKGFIIVPLSVYFLLGTAFLLMGFVSLCNIRTVMKHDGTKTDKLEKLMIRIGVFSLLYTVPAMVVIGCYVYELIFLPTWMLGLQKRLCENKQYSIPCPVPPPGESSRYEYPKPLFAVFMMKYFMALIVGITSGFWVWSGKTFSSWKNVYLRMCGRKPINTQAPSVAVKHYL